MASPTSAGGEPAGVDEAVTGPAASRIAWLQPVGREGQIRGAGEVAGDGGIEVDDGGGDALAHGRDRLRAGGHDDVAAQDQARAAGRDAWRADLVLGRGDLEVGEDGAALLRHADHVERGDTLALQMRAPCRAGPRP